VPFDTSIDSTKVLVTSLFNEVRLQSEIDGAPVDGTLNQLRNTRAGGSDALISATNGEAGTVQEIPRLLSYLAEHRTVAGFHGIWQTDEAVRSHPLARVELQNQTHHDSVSRQHGAGIQDGPKPRTRSSSSLATSEDDKLRTHTEKDTNGETTARAAQLRNGGSGDDANGQPAQRACEEISEDRMVTSPQIVVAPSATEV